METELPTCVVTIIHLRGALSRTQMDEKSPQVIAYACGTPLFGYGVKTSSEGIDHVRVSPIGKKPTEWIRCWEKDHSNPLVSIDPIVRDNEATQSLADAIEDLAKAIRDHSG